MTQLEFNPTATATVFGAAAYPDLRGTVTFTPVEWGVLIMADIRGLPVSRQSCVGKVFAFHIHEGADCGGNDFSHSSKHYNPTNCPHPYHAGDLPPLFGNQGRAFLAVISNRFTIPEVIGRTVIIHENPDDFTTQPSGNGGAKIGCGIIHAI